MVTSSPNSKKRWFVLCDNRLIFYKEKPNNLQDKPARPKGTVLLSAESALVLNDNAHTTFTLVPWRGAKPHHLECESSKERNDWLSVLEFVLKHLNSLPKQGSGQQVEAHPTHVMKGFLFALNRKKKWKQRFISVLSDRLLIYKFSTDRVPLRVVELHDSSVCTRVQLERDEKYCFGLRSTYGSQLELFFATTHAVADEWVRKIQQQIDLGARKSHSSKLEGYLDKAGQFNKKVKNRYFVLDGKNLRYYKNKLEDKCIDCLVLSADSRISLVSGQDETAFSLEVNTGGRVYELWSDANSTAQQWVAAIQEVIRLCLSHKENTLETNETGSLKLL